MKNLALLFAAALFFAACTNQNKSTDTATDSTAVAVTDTVNAPVFNFEQNSYDFGQVSEGEKVSYDFKFTNTGKTPLVITDARASCGCTKPEYPSSPVAPGESGTIHVVFDSQGRLGMQNKVITIVANTVPSTIELNLVGEVKEKAK